MKKQSFFKLFAVLLAILMLLPTLAACGGDETDAPPAGDNNQPQNNQNNQTGNVDLESGDYLILGERGVTEFSLVYSTEALVLTKSEAVLLKEYITEVTEAEMTVIDNGSHYTNKEIYAGVVNKQPERPEMDALATEYNLGDHDYVIKVIDDDLVIVGGTKEASVMAITFLRKRLLYVDEESGIVAVRRDLDYAMYYDNYADKKGLEKVILNEMGEDELLFTLNPGSEKDVFCRLTYTGNGGWRIQTKYNMAEEFSDIGAAQLLSVSLGEDPSCNVESLTYWERDDHIIAQAPDGSYVVLELEKFALKFCNADGTVSRTLTEINHSITGKTNRLSLYVEFSLNDTEAIYGTGERFDSINQRGKQVIVQSGNVADDVSNSYVAIPLFASSRGNGFFVNNNGYMLADIGATDYNTIHVELTSGAIDCYVFVTDKITDVIENYGAISGYAEMPEEWTTGLLVCRYDADTDTAEAVYNMIAKMESYDLPWTGVLIDGWDIGDFSKHEELKEICEYVHSLGKKVICNVAVGFMPNNDELPDEWKISDEDMEGFLLGWTFEYYYTEFKSDGWGTSNAIKTTTYHIPLLSQAGDMIEAPIFVNAPTTTKDPATNYPFLTKVECGERTDFSDDVLYATRTYIDISNPVVVEWFFNTYWSYLVNDIGVDGAKIDGANTLPDAAGTLNFYDDTIPSGGGRAWYSTVFAAKINEILAAKPDSGVCFTSGGGIGSQRNSYIWGGEQSRTVNRLERQVKGLLSAGLSGLPFVTYDIGGSFYKNDDVLDIDKEANIFLRAAQFSIFTSAMQTVSGEVRGAFDFAEEDADYAYVTELYTVYAKMHAALSPYIMEYAEDASETGIPLARHLVLAYQNDKNVYDIEDEYLFGDAFLVAPELYGQSSREVYLPEGKWMNLFTGEEYTVGAEGQTITVNVTMAQIPVFYNMNTTSETAPAVLEELKTLIDVIETIEIPA